MAEISIHSPYTGRDVWAFLDVKIGDSFQSTLPIQGETRSFQRYPACMDISIHSPYTGRDKEDGIYFAHFCISIHSPYTGRDIMFAVSTEEELGISIHSPYTGRDTRLTDGRYYDEISIHSPYTGRD